MIMVNCRSVTGCELYLGKMSDVPCINPSPKPSHPYFLSHWGIAGYKLHMCMFF